MRLLLFLDTDHVSGPARLALDCSVQASRLGHQVLILGLVRGRRPVETAFSRAVREADVPLQLLHERFRFDPRIVGRFRRLLAEFKPDLYQSHGYKGSLLGRVARRWGVPWQAVFHGFTWENWKVRLYHRLDVRWLRQADEVIVVSRAFRDRLAREGVDAAKLRWVPNAIDEASLAATSSGENLRAEWFGAEPSRPRVVAGCLGRLSPEKAPDHFLRAFSNATRQEPSLHAVIVGDGPLAKDCRAVVAASGIAPRIVLAGFRRDPASVYQALDLLVIPSRSEGMPTVMLEAMAIRSASGRGAMAIDSLMF